MFERLQLFILRLVPSPVYRAMEGFWATPIAISVLGVALAVLVQVVPEESIPETWLRTLEQIDVDGARSALSVIAGGMISLVALVFSLTFVALSITAQQLSPRILDFVLRERRAQLLLGLALGTFLYAALVLILGAAGGAWRFAASLPLAIGLAAATLVMLVVFAHAMTRVMRAEEMVARLGDELVADVHHLLEPPIGCEAVRGDEDAFERLFDDGTPVLAVEAGYVGMIDYKGLVAYAAEHELRIALEARESDFLLPGVPVARVVGLHPDSDEPGPSILGSLNLTNRRETSNLAGYEAGALSEAALRALSPGINDPATAIACLNRVFEALAVLVTSERPPRLLAAGDGVASLIRPAREAPEFLVGAVVPVIAAARGDEQVLGRLVTLARQTDAVAIRVRDRAALAGVVERAERARRG